MMYRIPAVGPRNAELAIVAEKPGKDELARLVQMGASEPLIGTSGNYVDRHLIRIGTHRSRVWLTNAVEEFDTLGNPSDADLQREQVRLYTELGNLPNLKCIVAMGNAALVSLSNFQYNDVMHRRGSILPSFIRTKMVPTLHPSFYMRGEWRYKPVVEFDLKRALEQSRFPEINRPARTYYIEPTFNDAYDALRSLIGAKYVSFDIETFRGVQKGQSYISCIAFSTAPNEAYSIPIMRGNRSSYWSVEQECEIWCLIQRVLAQPRTIYVTQNGLFDCWHLWRHGIATPYMDTGFDTMYSHRYLAPGLPHDLAFLVSIYTEEPYYKDESGDWTSDIRVPDPQFWTYNCKDAACTLEVAFALMTDLREYGMMEYYDSYIHPQWSILADMRQRGLRVDLNELRRVRAKSTQERAQLESNIKDRIGWVPNTKSATQMGNMLSLLGVQYDRTATGRTKISEERLHTYAYYNPTARDVIVNCLDVTKRRTVESSFLTMQPDSQGYYHPFVDLEKAVTGRNASKGDDAGGPQIHNIPKRIRKLFIADDDECEITNIDLKQAEAQCVAWDAHDPLLMSAFIHKKDVHGVRACIIYRDWLSDSILPPDDLLNSILRVCATCQGLGETECNHSERYMGKQSGHAFAYGMGPQKFCTIQAKNNVFIDFSFAKRVKERVVSIYILAWHERVKTELLRTGWLVNVLGRKREFYGIYDNEMLHAALSWLCQSAITSIKERAIIHIKPRILDIPRARIITETHDSLTFCHLKTDRARIVQLGKEAFHVPLNYHGEDLLIGVDITHGPNWGEQKEVSL
jgi:uracil-DNA glycosylase family 4